jgi:hypothetical protein
VGDAGAYYETTDYSDGTKSLMSGNTTFTYQLAADGSSSTTALLNILRSQTDTQGRVLESGTSVYRIGVDGSIARLSEKSVDSSGTLNFTYR